MSKKYRDRLLEGSGMSNKSYESEYGLKLLKKMGWTEGNGLGKLQHGRTDCVQIKRRSEGLGLGCDSDKKFQWNDNWWENTFNSAVQNLVIKNKLKENQNDSQSDLSSDDEIATKPNNLKRKLSSSSTDYSLEAEKLRKKIQKEKLKYSKKSFQQK